jgi:cytochrome P450
MSLQTIILGLAAYPEAQKNCQAEIDALFGDEHLPDKLDQRDLEKLPFLHACALEGQRWRPPGSFAMGSFGLPRECTKDEEILGYTIPKGTSVVINQFTIAQDPEFYDDPDSFIPSRYIEEPNGLKKGVSQVGRRPGYSFGIGRRECPGKALFFQNIEIALSHVLWAFDIVAEEHLDTSFQTGYLPKIAMIPKPFKIKFVPRRSREVLLQEKEKAEASVSQFFA